MARNITLNFSLLFYFVSFFSLFFQCLVAGDFNIAEFGAKSDGITDTSNAFISAWAAACASLVPAMVYVPPGKYLLRPVAFAGPCKNNQIVFQIDGILVAPANYATMGSASNWLLFDSVTGVSVSGGFLDGQGASLWACKAGGGNCPAGAATLAFNQAKDIVISNVTSLNSELYHIIINNSENVTVQGVTIQAPALSPNTDGIHVQNSIGVRIFDTGIKTGDDCVSIGPGTQNLWIQRVACGPGHGISIGSLGKVAEEDGVQNVTVKTVVFTGSDNGLRIKTWGRESNGFVTGVVFQHAVMKNVMNPIIIDQNYCPNNQGCSNQQSGIKISQVKYINITGTSASKIAVNFDCSASSPCQGIWLEDIQLTFQDQPAQSECQNVDGTAVGLVVPPSCL